VLSFDVAQKQLHARRLHLRRQIRVPFAERMRSEKMRIQPCASRLDNSRAYCELLSCAQRLDDR
jgi:hypothetical protein